MTTVEEDIKAWADKHLLDEQEEKKANPFFDYVTIPISEYRKLIRKVEKLKAQKLAQETQYISQSYLDRALAAEKQVRELHKNLDDAKQQIEELLGLQEFRKVNEQQGIRLCNKQEEQNG